VVLRFSTIHPIDIAICLAVSIACAIFSEFLLYSFD